MNGSFVPDGYRRFLDWLDEHISDAGLFPPEPTQEDVIDRLRRDETGLFAELLPIIDWKNFGPAKPIIECLTPEARHVAEDGEFPDLPPRDYFTTKESPEVARQRAALDWRDLLRKLAGLPPSEIELSAGAAIDPGGNVRRGFFTVRKPADEAPILKKMREWENSVEGMVCRSWDMAASGLAAARDRKLGELRREKAALLRQGLYRGKPACVILQGDGSLLPVPPNLWGTDGAFTEMVETGKYDGRDILVRASVSQLTASESSGTGGSQPAESLPKDVLSDEQEMKCKEWLVAKMRASPDRRTASKGALQEEANKIFKVSKNAFQTRIWPSAAKEANAQAWCKAGRTPRTIQAE